MDDLIKSLKAQLYDRATSPLLSSFLISWVIWNYRLVVVLSSSNMKTREKLGYIDQYLYPSWDVVVWQGIFAPLLSALVLIFVYPIPALWVFAYARRQQLKAKKVQQAIEDETPLSQEEARKLRAELWRAHAAHDQAIREREETIQRLKVNLAAWENTTNPEIGGAQNSETSTSPIAAPTTPSQGELNVTQMRILTVIVNMDSVAESDLFEMTKLSKVQLKYYLDELERMAFIVVGYGAGGRYFSSTPAGRKWVVEHVPKEVIREAESLFLQ